VATGSELSNPRVFRWGLCGYKVFLNSDCVIAHAKGHAPPKCSGVLLLVADRTPHESRGRKWGCSELNRDTVFQPS
jgi:hypothetical protein